MYPQLCIFRVEIYHDNMNILSTLASYKNKYRLTYIIVTSVDRNIIKEIVEKYDQNLFDDIIECDLLSERQCIQSISKIFDVDPHFMAYFGPESESIKSLVYWATPKLTSFSTLLKQFSDTMNKIQNLVDVPTNRYVSNHEAQMFLHYLKQYGVCSNRDYIKYCIEVINILYKDDDIHIPISGVFISDTVELVQYYFELLKKFNDAQLYSLGDSLDKLNYLWNVTHPDSQIIAVPFSGSMYANIGDQIVLDPKESDLMASKFESLLIHNDTFGNMVQNIISGKKVLITDYGHSGKAYITITKLINNMISVDWSNVWYLQITLDPDIIDNNIEKHLNQEPHSHIIYHEDLPDVYFTNSDRPYGGYNSRCVPRYEVSNWNKSPDDIWSLGLTPNYRLCNIHRKLLLLQFCNYI